MFELVRLFPPAISIQLSGVMCRMIGTLGLSLAPMTSLVVRADCCSLPLGRQVLVPWCLRGRCSQHYCGSASALQRKALLSQFSSSPAGTAQISGSFFKPDAMTTEPRWKHVWVFKKRYGGVSNCEKNTSCCSVLFLGLGFCSTPLPVECDDVFECQWISQISSNRLCDQRSSWCFEKDFSNRSRLVGHTSSLRVWEVACHDKKGGRLWRK